MKRLAALILCLLMMSTGALAALHLPDTPTDGQRALFTYVDSVNAILAAQGAGTIDMQYELYSTFASLGMNGEDTPETIEMYFLLGDEGLHSLTLRICNADLFEKVAAACLHASSPSGIPLADAQKVTANYAAVLRRDLADAAASPESAMTHAFEEEVNDLQGSQPRSYFAYYPNQYGDGKYWLQMTLIFARPGSEGGSLVVTGSTPAPQNGDVEYEGYFSQDNYIHLEVFATPTPEPDSAAMEDW